MLVYTSIQTRAHSCKPCIEYLGHVVDEKGCHRTDEKVKAIREAPPPKNITELSSSGILNYYSKFLPNLSSNLTPLNTLLRKVVLVTDQNEAFTKANEYCRPIHSYFILTPTSLSFSLVMFTVWHRVGNLTCYG